ncbi:uncharacterized protein BT62DRAFT_1012494 [Guyanagaster necrorhizus]|uniref:Uncharacterized protein n=1 Tax=Guyanagaster necrorhizus TaxID=856835 RepID=A0A9P8AMD4_9AGAR|nr:uncharacterized protein BT62DRAFT_1012494 [Guyanagaster necrorhizus MCA 3950]KAG7440571.1 hypothetical protein BT62DRAFT_1012494 [Guyanagaster necrorhizus MCA 3950]
MSKVVIYLEWAASVFQSLDGELIGGGCKIIIEAAGERFGVAALNSSPKQKRTKQHLERISAPKSRSSSNPKDQRGSSCACSAEINSSTCPASNKLFLATNLKPSDWHAHDERWGWKCQFLGEKLAAAMLEGGRTGHRITPWGKQRHAAPHSNIFPGIRQELSGRDLMIEERDNDREQLSDLVNLGNGSNETTQLVQEPPPSPTFALEQCGKGKVTLEHMSFPDGKQTPESGSGSGAPSKCRS